ncbi:uncharacterized protein B0H64DRAFT_235115 [Chaetomium fimeti]|uniref:Uncharacterized protein n=1 Tax=Chaetomium fimeti TaxID=1854472 RepID=A0AAE0HAG8_9PEZI|nr:hypothetical protein B0H64DRAFT_235115 [Chaetomium fimeti]
MSWPGADESSGDSGQGNQFDRPTDLASIAVVKNGRLAGFTEEQADRALKLMSGPFESLPQLPFFASWFSYTPRWQKAQVASALIENSLLIGRLLSPAEADAFAYHRSKVCSRATYGTPAVLLTAAYYTNQGRSTFRFPFYTPKPASFNPMSFPTASMSLLKGQSAVRLWHVLRFGTYAFISQYIVKIIVFSFVQAGYLAAIAGDPRLKAVREEMTPSKKARAERSRLPPADGPANSVAVSPSPGVTSTGLDSPVPQTPGRRGWAPQTPQSVPESVSQQDDDSYLFDDASPVAPSQRERPSAGSPQSPGGGSAWDRIRQQAKSEEGQRWNPRQQQNRTSGSQQTTDQYTYTPAEQEKAYAKEQAQKEFDAMLERERHGTGDSGGRK